MADYQWQLNGLDLPGATDADACHRVRQLDQRRHLPPRHEQRLGTCDGAANHPDCAPHPAPVRQLPAGIQMTNGEAHLRLSGASGVGPVVLLASSDLLAWEPILTNPPVIGPVQFIDAGAGNHARRFYRAFEGAVAGPLRIEIAAPRFTAERRPFPLRLTGLTAKGPVVIYASSNLLDWAAVFTNPPTIGPLQYLEELSTVQPQRFYRASENH